MSIGGIIKSHMAVSVVKKIPNKVDGKAVNTFSTTSARRRERRRCRRRRRPRQNMGPTQRRSSDDVTSSRQRRLERQHLGRHPYDVLTRLHDCNYGTQFSGNIYLGRMGSVVVVQLAELSIPTPEDQGSNSAVRNFIKNIYLLSTVYKRLNVGNCPFRKKH